MLRTAIFCLFLLYIIDIGSIVSMSGPELLLDSSIRIWVVLPIVFITFVFGIIRHYLSLLMASEKTVSIEQVRDG